MEVANEDALLRGLGAKASERGTTKREALPEASHSSPVSILTLYPGLFKTQKNSW